MKKFIRLIDKINTELQIPYNPLWDDCGKLFGKYLGDLNDEELLRTLYIANSSSSLSRLPAFILNIENNEYRDMTNMAGENLIEIKLKENDGRLVCLIGDAGIGKSTYLKYTLNVEIKDLGERYKQKRIPFPKIYPIYLDFLSATTDIDKIQEWVIQKLYEKIKPMMTENNINIKEIEDIIGEEMLIYKELYNEEVSFVEKKKKLIESLIFDKDFFIKIISKHLKTKKDIDIIVIFDNLDHHADERYISKVIRIAKMVLNEYAYKVIIALRKDNSDKMIRNTMSTIRPILITFDSPAFDKMLKRRLEFLHNEIIKRKNLSYKIQNPEFLLQEKVFHILKSAAGYNHRILLDTLKHIFMSGYLYDRKNEIVKYTYLTILRALLYGNYRIFKPKNLRIDCIFLNLIDNDDPLYEGNWLIRLRLLQVLENKVNYVKKETVINQMSLLGYIPNKVSDLIDSFSTTSNKLIEKIKEYENYDISNEIIKISELGRLHLKIFNQIEYIDAVRSATSLPGNIYERINGTKLNLCENNLSNRVAEIRNFINFIANEEIQEFRRINDTTKIFEAIKMKETVFTIKDNFSYKWERSLQKISATENNDDETEED